MQTVSTNILLSDILNNVDIAGLKTEPVKFKTKDFSGLIISESNWCDIEETLYLMSIKGMRESLVEGINTPIDECSEKLDW